MMVDVTIVAFLTLNGVVHVGEIPALDYPQVVHRQPSCAATGRATVTVPAVTHIICADAGKFYGACPAVAIRPWGYTCNYLLRVAECQDGSVTFPQSRVEGITPMLDTIEQAITYCDLVAQET